MFNLQHRFLEEKNRLIQHHHHELSKALQAQHKLKEYEKLMAHTQEEGIIPQLSTTQLRSENVQLRLEMAELMEKYAALQE